MTPLVTISVPAYAPVDYEALASAIEALESRPGRAIGIHGEVGPFQFKPETWTRFTEMPIWCALDRQKAAVVAERALRHYAAELQARGIEPTIYRLALCWKCGDNAVLLHRYLGKEEKDYAIRVENLYTDRLKHAPALSPQPSTISP